MIEPIIVEAPKTGLQYRELTAEEIQSVKHVFDGAGAPLPDPRSSTFVGAIEEGKVIGFIVLQQKLHAEPAWIENGKSQIFSALAQKAEEVVLQRCGPTWIYLFTPAGRISQLAATLGFQVEPWVIMSRLVMPELPARGAVDLLQSESSIEPTQDIIDDDFTVDPTIRTESEAIN